MLRIADVDTAEYCRQIESYLCQKNDGHLIRVVGPSFQLVSGWAADGIPLKVAFRGIDRYVERYYRSGPRRRPVRIDSCNADVLDAFDEWRRAVGVASMPDRPVKPQASLPAHLERALEKLSSARALGRIGAAADAIVDSVSQALDQAKKTTGGVRGEARRELLARLERLDQDLLAVARDSLSEADRTALAREAESELADFRDRITGDAYARALEATMSRAIRERFGLPTLILDPH